MLKLFGNVKPMVAPKPKIQVPRPDNIVFRLHYRVTFAILLVCVILVSSYQYIDSSGSAIQCMTDNKAPVSEQVINRFCWIQSTFTLPKYYEGNEMEDFLSFGVGPYKEEDEKVYHAYYQWVPIVLFFQALSFYFPHWMWKHMEGGRMKHVIVGLNNHIMDPNERGDKVSQLADYLQTRMKYAQDHRGWAIKFFLCEVLNFINVIAQIFITDAFIQGEFTTYGIEVLKFPAMESQNRVDPMAQVFPKMTKCTFHKYGSSGTIQVIDALCVLGMNIINEKIYIFLWFWFLLLAVVTGTNLIVRLLQMSCPNLRTRFVKLENSGYLDQKVHRADVEAVTSHLAYADWLILYYLAQSMNKENFGELLSKLSEDLPTAENSSSEDEEAVVPNNEAANTNDHSSAPNGALKNNGHIHNNMTLKGPFGPKRIE